MWGLLLVDIARHAARAYARESDFTEEEALTRIVDMFEAEIARPTDMGSHHAAVATGSLTMPINILMPALSPTMEKGNLAKWLKKEGDKVKSGDVIAEIETDKATMEVEAVDEGTIAKILVPEGTQDVPVNDVIAVLAGEGEDVKAAASGGASAPPKAAEAPAPSPRLRQRSGRSASAEAPRRSAGARAAGRRAGRAGQRSRPHLLLAAGAPSRQGGRHRPRRASTAPARTAASSRATSRRRNPARALKAPARRAGSARPRIAPSMSDEQIRALFEDGSYEVVPHDGMRKTIAQRLTASKQTDPAFLSDDRLRHRQAAGRARGDQCRRRRRTRRQAGSTSSRSTTSSSRRWRSRCSACPTPM